MDLLHLTLFISISGLLVYVFKYNNLWQKMNDLRIEKERLTNKYSKLIDVDLEIGKRQSEINRLQREIKEFHRKHQEAMLEYNHLEGQLNQKRSEVKQILNN